MAATAGKKVGVVVSLHGTTKFGGRGGLIHHGHVFCAEGVWMHRQGKRATECVEETDLGRADMEASERACWSGRV